MASTSRVPMGRFIEPIEVAQVVAFLLSEDAAMITGSPCRSMAGY